MKAIDYHRLVEMKHTNISEPISTSQILLINTMTKNTPF